MLQFRNQKIILGSGSPRRKELLSLLDVKFKTISLNVNEDFPKELSKEKIVKYLCEKKSLAYSLKQNEILITADTIVWVNNKVLNKPHNVTEAKSMLKALSGVMHSVYTGVCIRSINQKVIFSDCSKVYFQKLSTQEVDYYIKKYKPFDKAGSYGVQEWLGAIGIAKIQGSYFNVMGLPVHLVYQHLKKFQNG